MIHFRHRPKNRISKKPVIFFLTMMLSFFTALPGCHALKILKETPEAGRKEISPTVWTFSNKTYPLKPLQGKGILSFRTAYGKGWSTGKSIFGKASELGLPLISGRDTSVMGFPATIPGEGYSLRHGASPNGVFKDKGRVSNYTIVMDILLPKRRESNYLALYQTDSANRDDAEMYIDRSGQNRLGISGRYHGRIREGRWHRVAISVQAASGPGGVGQLHKYVDGEFLGGHGTNSGGAISRWALGPEFLLFADNNGETSSAFVSSIYFIDRNLSMEELAALGGPHAGGAHIAGPVKKRKAKKLQGQVKIVAHRGDSCCSPENTLTAIRRALDRGASMVEVDLRWSKDKVAVLMHDEEIDRTTSGTGPVNEKSLKELKKLDAGSWFAPEFRGERIPTLIEALKEAKGRGVLILDVKGMKMGAAIRSALKQAGVGPDAIYVWQNKFDEALYDFQRHLPQVGILWGGIPKRLNRASFARLKARGIVGFDLDIETEKVTDRLIAAAHRNGMFVSVYTILDPDRMRKVAALGVDAIETDFTAVLKGLLPD
ncbi:MAG: glycerophosphodiester phosphodiesterase family protein [bacterium]|nr:glycerophosphodiester phosphodiesterase family protein [bacterium]